MHRLSHAHPGGHSPTTTITMSSCPLRRTPNLNCMEKQARVVVLTHCCSRCSVRLAPELAHRGFGRVLYTTRACHPAVLEHREYRFSSLDERYYITRLPCPRSPVGLVVCYSRAEGGTRFEGRGALFFTLWSMLRFRQQHNNNSHDHNHNITNNHNHNKQH